MKDGSRLHRWRLWLYDDWCKWLWDDGAMKCRAESAVDWVDDHIVERVHQLTCLVFGHEPIPDHCGKHEHEHCAWCRKSMPYAATERAI